MLTLTARNLILTILFVAVSNTSLLQSGPSSHIPATTPPPQTTPVNVPTKPAQTNPDHDPVARKILELFAASVLAFAKLVSDPQNPSNIKSALFGMATCWYQIFTEATKPTN